MPAPHSHDGFEETIYGLEGVSAWTIDGETVVSACRPCCT
jgi:quercetin dioxygenase-like cupin family protein